MMLKRTPGSWRWKIKFYTDEKYKNQLIAILNENTDDPHIVCGDISLMRYVAEMHDLLYEVKDELDKAISDKRSTTGIETLLEDVSYLLKAIDVERPKEDQ